MRATLLVLAILSVTALGRVHGRGRQQICPPQITQVAEIGVTCRLMTPAEKDSLNGDVDDEYQDDSDQTLNCSSIMSHGSAWLDHGVWVISGGDLLNSQTGFPDPNTLAKTAKDTVTDSIYNFVRSDQLREPLIPFHEGPHFFWFRDNDDLDPHTWWDGNDGASSWEDYCRDPDDFANPPEMEYDVIQD